MATYREKLLDPRWQKKRLEILNRANFACENCGATKETLHIHHGYYEHSLDPWEYEDETLHCFCWKCHELMQARLRDIHLEIARIGTEFDDLTMSAIQQISRLKFFVETNGREINPLTYFQFLAFLMIRDALEDGGEPEHTAPDLIDRTRKLFEAWIEYQHDLTVDACRAQSVK